MFKRVIKIFNDVRKFIFSYSAIMTYYLIATLIITIIIRKIAGFSTEPNVNFQPKNSTFYYTFEKTVPINSEESSDEVKFDQQLDNSTEVIASQDRISYHSKRGAPYPHRFSHPHFHHHFPHPHHHHHHHHRPPYYKPKKKYRRKKPYMGRSPYLKSSYKRQKPILLSEVLRNGGYGPYSKIKPPIPIIKDYIEEEDLETSPFSPIDTIESYPSFTRNVRPQSFEIADESPDIIPIQPIEEEIIVPGVSGIKPITSVIKKLPSVWSSSKPSDIYVDSDVQDNTRNVRYVANKPQSYLDKDIINLLQKIKNEGMNSDSKTSSSESVSQIQKNITEANFAISKLLFPFLSENAIKQIQLYFKSIPSDKQHKNDKHSLENQFNEMLRNTTQSTLRTQNPPPKQYSVTESVKEDDDNVTYYIMVKTPGSRGINSTELLSQKLNKFRWLSPQEQTFTQKEIKSTTPPSRESLALQKYIMMLAGITKETGTSTTDNYLPRFNSFQKQMKKI